MDSRIKKLKKIAIDKTKFYWEQEDAIDTIACDNDDDARNALADIANDAKYSWVRKRALDHLKSNC